VDSNTGLPGEKQNYLHLALLKNLNKKKNFLAIMKFNILSVPETRHQLIY